MKFFDLIRFTQTNFWHSNYDRQEKLIVDDCKRLCAIFIVVLSFCTQGTCAGYMVTPLLENIGKNESDRILPFNMWVDFPTGVSPYFEVLFIIQILCVYHVGVCYICFDNFLCLANLHVSSQFQVLQYRLISLNDIVKKQIRARASNEILSNYENECYQKLKNCVHQHQSLIEYCKMLENIFAMIVLGQVLFLAMVTCLVGYQLFLADTPPSKSVSLILNMAAVLCQLFMFTYSCDGLIRQSVNVGSATFSGPWAAFSMDTTGKLLRKNITIIIMRSNRCCCLTANGFFPVSLETYTGVLSTAMSYFTLLRQSTLDMENT
ncbi:odorant receptor 13a-like [Colletes latitarsis]|uniref:odorant receptor 13a-like n=1 Tax=Colletes latitarsis TaxID=2605962 RepID=UPI0040369DC1